MNGIRQTGQINSQFYVCVDDVANHDIIGKLYSHEVGYFRFRDVVQMVNAMELFFQQMNYPQCTHQIRGFGVKNSLEPNKGGIERMENDNRDHQDKQNNPLETSPGQKATFVVQVQYRQNASWQGTVQWLDQKKTQHFRSALELLKLIDDAVATSESNPEFQSWGEAVTQLQKDLNNREN